MKSNDNVIWAIFCKIIETKLSIDMRNVPNRQTTGSR